AWSASTTRSSNSSRPTCTARWSASTSPRPAAFRTRFCPWDDGRAAERVVRRVFLGEEPPAPAS
ncbi:CDP-glycerol glycerophosphotransferase family protein, partial [Streptomyces albidoflavus]